MKTDELKRRLAEALAERDEALRALAAEREISNALRLGALPSSAIAADLLPNHVGPGPIPMRYQLVDRANDALKRWLGPLHRGAKQVASRLKDP